MHPLLAARYDWRIAKPLIKQFKLQRELDGRSKIKKPIDRAFYKNKIHVHHNQVHNPANRREHRENAPYYSINDIHYNTRQSNSSIDDRESKAAIFRFWYEGQLAYDYNMPTWDQMRYDCNQRLRFCENIQSYLQYVFNSTFNMGKSLQPYLAGVIYVAKNNGVSFNQGDFKWWSSFKRGCNEISRNHFHTPPDSKKRAIFNPMLERMLEYIGSDPLIRFGVLFAHRFCARAQQFVHTNATVDILCYDSLHFDYDKDGHVDSLTYRNVRDKNHQWGEHPMDRTIYCTCHTRWTCFPCFADKVFKFNKKHLRVKGSDPIMKRDGNMISYNDWWHIIQALMAQIGCDPEDYGTHSLRAGGTSERDIMGKSPKHWIQYLLTFV